MQDQVLAVDDGAVERDRSRAALSVHLAALAFGQRAKDVAATTRRDAASAAARRVAVYLTHVGFGLSMDRVAAAFGRTRTAVGWACNLVEDARDDPGFDARVSALEGCVRQVLAAEAGEPA